MPKITQFNNTDKKCRKCPAILEVGKNWAPNNCKQYNYICNSCQNIYNNARRAAKRKPKPTEKYCIDCDEPLEENINWTKYNKSHKFYVCNICASIRNHDYHEENKDYNNARNKKYREDHPEETAAYFKDPENKKRAKENRERRMEKDPSIRLRVVVSSYIRNGLFANGSSKNGESCWKHLAYTPEELKQHLESQFEPWMNWDNYGKYKKETWNDNDQSTWIWNIDHLVPHSTFKYKSMEDQAFKDCWAIDNLRPYSAKQNQLDGATLVRHKNNENEVINDTNVSIEENLIIEEKKNG